jgi:hypothetical protein
MATDHEEIEDADLDEEENSDEEDQGDDSEDESGDDTSDDDSEEDEDDSEDDEDDDSSDSDEDDDTPLTVGALKKVLPALLKGRENNRSAAARRVSEKGRNTQKGRPDPIATRLEQLEKTQRAAAIAEDKRQFGYENGLSPDEVDLVFRMTKRPTAKALKDPAIAGALEGLRTAKRARNNTPGAGNGRQGRPAPRENKNATPAEKRENFIERRRSILDQRTGR